MARTPDQLAEVLRETLAERIAELKCDRGEVTVQIRAADLIRVAETLRDAEPLQFELLVDLCGVDYCEYGDGTRVGKRFAVVYHLLSVEHNQRLRLRVFCEDDEFPLIASVVATWPAAAWYEREAFDLFGIMFEGHPDLRRLLTDYGFIGHPFRKDFPLSGQVEMRYDPDQGRVVYQPVTIEPRNNVPRVVREETYGDTGG